MRRRFALAITLTSLWAVTACGAEDPGSPAGSAPPAGPGSAAASAPAAGPHPLAGTWQGPPSQIGPRVTLVVAGDGTVTFGIGPESCTGKVTGAANAYRLSLDECALSLPDAQASLSADGKTMTLVEENGKVSTWRRQG